MRTKTPKVILFSFFVQVLPFFITLGWAQNPTVAESYTVDFSRAKGAQIINPEHFQMNNIIVTTTQQVPYSVLWEMNYNNTTLKALTANPSSTSAQSYQRRLDSGPVEKETHETRHGESNPFTPTIQNAPRDSEPEAGPGYSVDFRNVMLEPASKPEQIKMKNILVSYVDPNFPTGARTEVYNIILQFNYTTSELEVLSGSLWTASDMPSKPAEVCPRPANLVDVTNPNTVVGTGTPATCDETTLKNAIDLGGIITFNCGPGPVNINITSEKKITKDTTIDGGGLVTLSGGGITRILNMDTGNFNSTGPHLRVQRITFANGRATNGTPTRLGFDYDGGGAAIYYRGGSVTIVDSIFFNNVAAEIGPDVGGGAVYGVGVGVTTIVGSRLVGNRGSNGGAVGALHTEVIIANSTITHNIATGFGANYQDPNNVQQGSGGNGGAIVMDGDKRTLGICGCNINNNMAGSLGGGVFRTGYISEPSIIDRTTVDSNRIRIYSDTTLPNGAGSLYLQGNTVTLTNSTISNNAALTLAGIRIMGHGPAAPGFANLTNVTITGNYTYPMTPFTNRGIGAGLIIDNNATGTIQNCTIVDNDSQFGTGIINVGTLTVNNSIISNTADNTWVPANCTGSNYSGAAPSGSGQNNIQWANGQTDMDCASGLLTRAPPLMGILSANGGPTQTIPPLSTSPAIGAGKNCPSTDQRGVARPDPCAAGAFEPL